MLVAALVAMDVFLMLDFCSYKPPYPELLLTWEITHHIWRLLGLLLMSAVEHLPFFHTLIIVFLQPVISANLANLFTPSRSIDIFQSLAQHSGMVLGFDEFTPQPLERRGYIMTDVLCLHQQRRCGDHARAIDALEGKFLRQK